jgi:hypothetical protein
MSRARHLLASILWRVGVRAHDSLWLPLSVSTWFLNAAESVDPPEVV